MGKTPRNFPSTGHGYGRKRRSLSDELTEFAAKRALGRVIDVAVRQAEYGLTKRLQSRRNQPKPQTYRKKEPNMFTKTSTQTRSNTTAKSDNADRVQVWVNTVFIEEGNKISRIGSGRPVTTYKANAPVDTKDEDFNEVNAVSNVIVQGILDVADKLEEGTTQIIAPAYAGNEDTFVGFAFEIRRVEDNEATRAAAKADIESKTSDRLGSLFG